LEVQEEEFSAPMGADGRIRIPTWLRKMWDLKSGDVIKLTARGFTRVKEGED
jgi:bifunctional DNA-binding transcriptional regulator/antitoxin component of YhaV-PrlF toxin-antitoxin module